MRIRTFTAPTMAEAMAQVREAMGDDAIIVSTYEGRRGRGVEVRAAVEQIPDPAATRRVAHTLDETSAIEAALRARLQAELGTPIEPRGGARAAPQPQTPAVIPPPQERHAGPAQSHAPAPSAPLDLRDVGQALVFHRVPSALGKAILADAKRFDAETGALALTAAMETRFGFSPLPDVPRRPLLLIGPPGVGKTASAAKLAARAVLAGGHVDLITTDTVKAGGVAQMEAFAGLLEAECTAADTPQALQAAVAKARAGAAQGPRTIIVDTPGTNPFNRAEREDLIAFLKAADMEPVLVLAAGADIGDLVDSARIFQEMGARRLIVTRIDAARRLGSILWLLQSTGLALAQASRTPYLAEGLTPMDPGLLARLVLSVPPSARPQAPGGGAGQPAIHSAPPSPAEPEPRTTPQSTSQTRRLHKESPIP